MVVRNGKITLNSNQLKLLAICAMVIDHCAATLLAEDTSWYWCMRLFGRLAAPIMCFFIAEGYYHTANLKKYMSRLLLMAVISHVPYNHCFGMDIWAFWESTDVVFSLLFGLAALTIWNSSKMKLWQKCGGLTLCCLLAYSADWNYIAVLWILGFGIFYGDRQRQLLFYCLIAGVYLAQPLVYGTSISLVRLGVFSVIPLLLRYSGERGKKSKLIQWGFYWFYPIHLLIIFGICFVV